MATMGESKLVGSQDEFNEAFVKALDSEHMVLIESLVLMKQRDPRFPLDVNQCAIETAIRGNAGALSRLLPLNPRMSYTDSCERRAIHYAAENGHLECVRLLLKAGAISNCSDGDGRTPLHLACSMGHAEIVKLLVQQCAHINSCRTEKGENAVHVTAATNYIEVMRVLLDGGGYINSATTNNKGGETPLHKAVAADKPEMVEYLCQRGAIIETPDALGKYPIHLACEKGFLRCLTTLIRCGASLEVLDTHKQTPLSTAIGENQTRIARLLIDEGADVHAVDKNGCTALHEACLRENEELIDCLVSAGANINARMYDNLHTPLMSSVFLGRLKSIQTLVALGADVSLTDVRGHTALHLVHMKPGGGSIDEIIRALLEGGGRLDVRDHANMTPLQRGLISSVVRKTKVLPWLQLLCQAGSYLGPDQHTMGKKSPLFWLAYSGCLQEAAYLVRAGWELDNESWVVLPGKDERQDRLHRFMIETFKAVPSLLECCRKVLRSYLSEVRNHCEILSAVDALPLPASIKSFLKLYDIDPEDISFLDEDI